MDSISDRPVDMHDEAPGLLDVTQLPLSELMGTAHWAIRAQARRIAQQAATQEAPIAAFANAPGIVEPGRTNQ